MQKTYLLYKKIQPLFIVELITTMLFGVLSFLLYYDDRSYTLYFPTAVTALYLLFLLLTLLTGVYLVLRSHKFGVVKIKRNSKFLMFAGYLASAMVFIVMIVRFVQFISPGENDASYTYRVLQFLAMPGCAVYFFISVFPSRIHRKQIKIPQPLKYFLSVCTVFWALFGILTIYFYQALTTNNIFKIMQLLIYVSFTIFFLYEAQFEHLKPNQKMYILSAILCVILTFGFSVCALVCKVLGTIPASQCFTAIEFISTLSIGLYAMARIRAVYKTMKHVMDEERSEEAGHHHHHHHHHHSEKEATAEESKPTDEQKATITEKAD